MDDELQRYKNATWDFLMEHCDILGSGSIFVKFHTDSRKDFERRVKARRNGYHREDVRAKEAERVRRLEVARRIRVEKHEAWKERERRRRRWGWLKILGIKI